MVYDKGEGYSVRPSMVYKAFIHEKQKSRTPWGSTLDIFISLLWPKAFNRIHFGRSFLHHGGYIGETM